MAILIDNRQKNHPIEIQNVQKTAQVILNALDCPDGELSVVIVDDAQIAELNQTYLNHQGPTNVISFPMREGDYGDINPGLIGDVVISMDTCVTEAADAAITAQERFNQLLVHGILHLFGYDHIHSRVQADAMEAKSEELLQLIDLNE
jgi:probable rRNA maturation factor